MKTLSDYRLGSDLRNEAYLSDMPGNMLRLHDSFMHPPARPGTCYVILEEQPDDVMVDDNGNSDNGEVRTSPKGELSRNKNRNDVKNNDNITFIKSSSSRLDNMNEKVNFICDDNDIVPSSLSSSLRRLPASHFSLSNKLDVGKDVSSNISLSDSSFRQPNLQPLRKTPDVKSGHLVLIVSDLTGKYGLLKSDKTTRGGSRTELPQRCPVVVKIGGQGYEKYAIISGTRRHRGSKSVCLKLKHSHATQSTSNPSQFTVILDGDDGKTFTFEAGSPEVASDWTYAFSSVLYSPTHRNGSSRRMSGVPSQASTTPVLGHVPLSSPPLNLSHVPLMPVLSESLDEDDEDDDE